MIFWYLLMTLMTWHVHLSLASLTLILKLMIKWLMWMSLSQYFTPGNFSWTLSKSQPSLELLSLWCKKPLEQQLICVESDFILILDPGQLIQYVSEKITLYYLHLLCLKGNFLWDILYNSVYLYELLDYWSFKQSVRICTFHKDSSYQYLISYIQCLANSN